jgi:hypothetical protein
VHGNAGGLCAANEVTQTRVVPAAGDIQRLHGFRLGPQPGGHGVKANQEA